MPAVLKPNQEPKKNNARRACFIPAFLTAGAVIAVLFPLMITCTRHEENGKAVSHTKTSKTNDASLHSSWDNNSLASEKTLASEKAMPPAIDSIADASGKSDSTVANAQSPSSIEKIDTASMENNKTTFSKEKMRWVNGGSFTMGSTDGQDDEKPMHWVKVRGFYLDEAEVIQEDYRRVMGKNPSYFKDCFDCPVENVTWYDAKKYCEKIGKRLPREEEWEYAYRAGSMAKYPWGDNFDAKYAWYHENADFKTHSVENKIPNSWGFYDMSGNVWEWCSDPWHPYSSRTKAAPEGSRSAPERIIRGGAWDKSDYVLRSSARGRFNPEERANNIGFRCAH